jgi:hypothetical protein
MASSFLAPQTQIITEKAKEYGMNKLTPFTGDRTKIRQFLQNCLGYLEMNQEIYQTDRLKIGFILSYMNDGEAANWKEYYLDTLKNLTIRLPKYPTLAIFLADVQKVFCAADRVRNAVLQTNTIITCLLFFITCSYTFLFVSIFTKHAEEHELSNTCATCVCLMTNVL